ncbi:MAG: GntR family transcriptional regulator [Chloroflexota bacterium]
MPFTPAPRSSLRQTARDEIRRRILLGELRPGERLVEATIAREMNISRAPVREAIRQLEQEGLIAEAPNHSPIVESISKDDVLESYELRTFIEARAIRRSVKNVNDKDIADLKTMIDQMAECSARGDSPGMVEADVAFHERICMMAQSRPLLQAWRSLGPHTWTFMTVVKLGENSEHDLNLARRHDDIVAGLASRSPDLAEAAITVHIRELESRVMRKMSDAKENVFDVLGQFAGMPVQQ